MKIRIIYEADTPEEFARAQAQASGSIQSAITDLAYLARRQTTTLVPRFAGQPSGKLVDVGLIISSLQKEVNYTHGQMEQAAGEFRYTAAADNQSWAATIEALIQMVEESAE